jgi:hypothetical protein
MGGAQPGGPLSGASINQRIGELGAFAGGTDDVITVNRADHIRVDFRSELL